MLLLVLLICASVRQLLDTAVVVLWDRRFLKHIQSNIQPLLFIPAFHAGVLWYSALMSVLDVLPPSPPPRRHHSRDEKKSGREIIHILFPPPPVSPMGCAE